MKPRKPIDIIHKSKTRAFLVTHLANIQYLTGLSLTFGIVLITSRSWTLFTDSRYLEAAEKNCPESWKVKDVSKLKSALSKIEQCGFESEHISVAQFASINKKYTKTKFVRKTGIVEQFRRSKDSDELRYFKRSQSITRKILKSIPAQLQKGISEQDLAWFIVEAAHTLGADEVSFDPIVAFGSHTSRPHHKTTTRRLRQRDIIQIDCGVRYKGYCSDQSRVFFLGEPTAAMERVYEHVERAKKEATAMVKDGALVRDIDKHARSILAEGNYDQYFTHSLGHGVGLDIHEGVSISSRAKNTALLQNEIVTIEPGVYIPGKFGMRLEDEVIVK